MGIDFSKMPERNWGKKPVKNLVQNAWKEMFGKIHGYQTILQSKSTTERDGNNE